TKRMTRTRTPQYLTSNTGQGGDQGHLAAVRPWNL
uniref:Uncharacterized protein n=1 Tax=Sus scrofa TaxID=9823 RepID=A0A8D0JVT7_PIG